MKKRIWNYWHRVLCRARVLLRLDIARMPVAQHEHEDWLGIGC